MFLRRYLSEVTERRVHGSQKDVPSAVVETVCRWCLNCTVGPVKSSTNDFQRLRKLCRHSCCMFVVSLKSEREGPWRFNICYFVVSYCTTSLYTCDSLIIVPLTYLLSCLFKLCLCVGNSAHSIRQFSTASSLLSAGSMSTHDRMLASPAWSATAHDGNTSGTWRCTAAPADVIFSRSRDRKSLWQWIPWSARHLVTRYVAMMTLC